MKHLPDDLLRIILAFASPTVGARQLAARARTLDEEVEFRPSNEPENYPSDWKIVEKAVAHTHEQLDLLNALRAVSTGFRNLISYGSTRQLTSPLAGASRTPHPYARRRVHGHDPQGRPLRWLVARALRPRLD